MHVCMVRRPRVHLCEPTRRLAPAQVAVFRFGQTAIPWHEDNGRELLMQLQAAHAEWARAVICRTCIRKLHRQRPPSMATNGPPLPLVSSSSGAGNGGSGNGGAGNSGTGNGGVGNGGGSRTHMHRLSSGGILRRISASGAMPHNLVGSTRSSPESVRAHGASEALV